MTLWKRLRLRRRDTNQTNRDEQPVTTSKANKPHRCFNPLRYSFSEGFVHSRRFQEEWKTLLPVDTEQGTHRTRTSCSNNSKDGADDKADDDPQAIVLEQSEYMNPSSPCQNLHMCLDEMEEEEELKALHASPTCTLSTRSCRSNSPIPPPATSTTRPLYPPKGRVALLCLDLQNDFLSDSEDTFASREKHSAGRNPLLVQRNALLDRIQDLASQVCALDGGVVCFLQSAYQTGPCCRVGTPGSAMYPHVAALIQQLQQQTPGNGNSNSNNVWLLTKQWYSAFLETVLHAQLQRLGVDTLIITGLTTNHSVAATVRSANRLGYKVILSTDGTAQLDPTKQVETCNQLEAHCHKLLPGNCSVTQVLEEAPEESYGTTAEDASIQDHPLASQEYPCKAEESRNQHSSGELTTGQGSPHPVTRAPTGEPPTRIATDSEARSYSILQQKLQARLVFDGCVHLSGLGAGDSILIPDALDVADKVLRDMLIQQCLNLQRQDPKDSQRLQEESDIPVWKEILQPAKEQIEQVVGHDMNWSEVDWQLQRGRQTFVYDESTSDSCHSCSDDEATECCATLGSLSSAKFEATLMLGEGRILQFQPKVKSAVLVPQIVYVHHNSLLLVGPETRRLYEHALFARKKAEKSRAPRIAVTFTSRPTATPAGAYMQPQKTGSTKVLDQGEDVLPATRRISIDSDEEHEESLGDAHRSTMDVNVTEEGEEEDGSQVSVSSSSSCNDLSYSESIDDDFEQSCSLNGIAVFESLAGNPLSLDSSSSLVMSRDRQDENDSGWSLNEASGATAMSVPPILSDSSYGSDIRQDAKSVPAIIEDDVSIQARQQGLGAVSVESSSEEEDGDSDGDEEVTNGELPMDASCPSSCSSSDFGLWDGSVSSARNETEETRPPSVITGNYSRKNSGAVPVSPLRHKEPDIREWDGTVATAVHNLEELEARSPCVLVTPQSSVHSSPSFVPKSSVILSRSAQSSISSVGSHDQTVVSVLSDCRSQISRPSEQRKDALSSGLEKLLQDFTLFLAVGALILALVTTTTTTAPTIPLHPVWACTRLEEVSSVVVTACAASAFGWWNRNVHRGC